MQNLFDATTYQEILSRLNQLRPNAERRWGKMTAAQMLAHCQEAFKVPLSPHKLPRHWIGLLFGWMVKAKLYNNEPWKKNLPTAPQFIIKNERNFETEMNGLLELIHRFHAAGPTGISKFPHPFFGHFTPEQWGQSMYKHLDHHLQQFGV